MKRAGNDHDVEIAIVGAGIVGLAVAYYLAVQHRRKSVLLIDARAPMSYTSAQSGDHRPCQKRIGWRMMATTRMRET